MYYAVKIEEVGVGVVRGNSISNRYNCLQVYSIK